MRHVFIFTNEKISLILKKTIDLASHQYGKRSKKSYYISIWVIKAILNIYSQINFAAIHVTSKQYFCNNLQQGWQHP